MRLVVLATHEPLEQACAEPHSVPSGTAVPATQVVCVRVASQAVWWVWHGSAVAGVQLCAGWQAAMQVPALQTLPVPQAEPSAMLLPTQELTPAVQTVA